MRTNLKKIIFIQTLSMLVCITMCTAQGIEQFTVSRNDKLHESWPDIALAANGDLVVAYQESDSHGGGSFSTIVSRVSTDMGVTWSKRVIVASTHRLNSGWLNCSKILCLQDNSLIVVIDNIRPHTLPPNSHHFAHYQYGEIWLYRSFDNGRTWHGPETTSICGGIVPSIAKLRDGTLLVGITCFQEDNNWRQYQVVYRSNDNGKTWKGPITVAKHPDRQPNEGDFVQLSTGEVVCYMRDDERPVKNGLKAISLDGGQSWSPLYGSGPWIYSGRPDVGLLSTGKVFLTTRVSDASQPGHYLGAYMEPENVALQPTPLEGPVPAEARWIFFDDDTNKQHPDWGYSGWVELPDSSVYIVQYITDDAPAQKPFIRGYHIQQRFIETMGRGKTE